ncbi:P22 coat protein - protein 5 domain protein [Curtobacterium sp. 'Ferrero']|uniref:P22 phage major capsid protein family protein n=1 Tax=Curtobacterium sp. 'Ferrero' TaxID=2033654 RepID=UPI000BDD3198|nr:P22 phage major capsid protein family protein [Curtobacterium sp. 'Ferrero']PCN47003.1 P22 coat protein - protein 5 domain protein [Curtobacterium sp. 'Ferrero']
MAFLHFRPTIWSPLLLVALRKSLIYSAFINRDYEGEIAEAGDSVRITSVGRPKIGTYVPYETKIEPEQLKDSSRTLIVDQSKFFAFEVDDVDKRQAKGDVMPQLMDEAAYAFADDVDQYLASFYTSIQEANQLTPLTIAMSKPTDFYDKVLVPLKVRLDKANVSTQGRSVAITPEQHGLLLLDPRFIKVNESGTTDGLRNGMVGRAAGFDILLSNNAPVLNASTGQSVVIAGNNRAITFAEQINKVEAYRPQDSFSDAVKGLLLYGGKNVRPDSLASASVTIDPLN